MLISELILLHFLCIHIPQFAQHNPLLETDLVQIIHGLFIGPGFKLMSPDRSNKYLKKE